MPTNISPRASHNFAESIGDFDPDRDFQEPWSVHPENVFVIKATYWIGR